MLQALNFKGKTALIMGASRGIGLATAQKLAQYGATTVLAARTYELIASAAQDINIQGGSAHAVKCDVTDYQAVERAVDSCLELTGWSG